MLALISPAKTMRSEGLSLAPEGEHTTPRFEEQTHHILSMMVRYNVQELAEIFKVSAPIARELRARFSNFLENLPAQLTALDSYDGVVFKHFKGAFSPTERAYLQRHLRISSLLYGLLRPLDRVRPYRMEGFVHLPDSDTRVDRYWRDVQTQTLIDDTLAQGGTLLYLASKEEQNAFHWRKVKEAVQVIEIQFLQQKGEKLRQVVVYTKMARGEMIRYMTAHQITNPEALKAFEWSGYRHRADLSTPTTWVWVME